MSKVIWQLYRCLTCHHEVRRRFRFFTNCPYCNKSMAFITSEVSDEGSPYSLAALRARYLHALAEA